MATTSRSSASSTFSFDAEGGGDDFVDFAARAGSLGSMLSLLLASLLFAALAMTLAGVLLACLVLREARKLPVLDDTPSVRFDSLKSAQPATNVTALMVITRNELNMEHPALGTDGYLT